ncbi:MAG: iron ABC transporter permease, partial [Spirochaetales bacterium]
MHCAGGRCSPIARISIALKAALFPALALIVAVPLAAAFLPLFRGIGPIANLSRALAEPRFLRSFGFGLGQALASSLLALALGLPGAYLLAKRRFPGKRILSAMSAVPFCVPPLIVAIGFVLYYGREGFLNRALMNLFGLETPPLDFLYSFAGIVMAHGFYNFPLVMRMVGDAWAGVPPSHEEAARLLGAKNPRVFFTVTLPSLLPAIGAALSLVFLMCFFSFVIVLLFGGPGVGTPEVELYRAARFEFDRELASAFALVESAVALAVLFIYAKVERKASGIRRDVVRGVVPTGFRTRLGLAGALAYGFIVVVFFLGPLGAVLVESFVVKGRAYGAGGVGLGNYASLFSNPAFGTAALNSLLLGLGSATLAAVAGFGFSLALKK